MCVKWRNRPLNKHMDRTQLTYADTSKGTRVTDYGEFKAHYQVELGRTLVAQSEYT